MPGTTNEARFTIEGTASEDANGNRGYDAINGQVLDVTLEVSPSSVSSATYSVLDPTVEDAPLASKNAPAITWVENSLKAITPSGVNDTVTITMPASGAHSYLIRCQVVTPSGAEIFERLVAIRTLGVNSMRKTIPAEAGQYSTRAESDDLNEMVNAISPSTGLVAELPMTNDNASPITQGQAVYVSDVSKVDLAVHDSRAEATAVGLVNEASIAAGAQGQIAFDGPVTVPSGVQTGTWTFGQRVYVDATAGKLTNTPPTATGKYVAEMGICLNTPGGGDATVLLQKRAVVGPLP